MSRSFIDDLEELVNYYPKSTLWLTIVACLGLGAFFALVVS